MNTGGDTCSLCGAKNPLLPFVGIALSMAGFHYAFCADCLENVTLGDFFRRLFTDEKYAWPPKPVEHVEPPTSLQATPRLKRPDPKERERSKMSNALRYTVMRQDNFCCRICGVTGKEALLAVDHIHPVARGGKTVLSNLRTLCRPCNAGKGTKLDTEKVEA